jgi:hypothetical protein
MKKIAALLVFAGFAMMLQSQTFVPTLSNTASADTTVQNPNGSSELASLMRDMQQYTSDARKAVLANQVPAPYPKEFEKLHTAKLTKGMSKSEFYDSFADIYIANVKSYSTSVPKDRISAYNNMVSSCVACHSQHCPGPTPMIKKLMIPTETK